MEKQTLLDKERKSQQRDTDGIAAAYKNDQRFCTLEVRCSKNVS